MPPQIGSMASIGASTPTGSPRQTPLPSTGDGVRVRVRRSTGPMVSVTQDAFGRVVLERPTRQGYDSSSSSEDEGEARDPRRSQMRRLAKLVKKALRADEASRADLPPPEVLVGGLQFRQVSVGGRSGGRLPKSGVRNFAPKGRGVCLGG